jgi:MFS family permease
MSRLFNTPSQKRSFANAVIFGGAGLGGASFPVLFNFLLGRLGFRWTARILSLLIGVLGRAATLGVKPRVPILPAERRGLAPPLNFRFLASPVFLAVVGSASHYHLLTFDDRLSQSTTIVLQGLAYFPVSLYIPTYVVSLGYSRTDGTIALAVFNLSTVVGMSVLSHRYPSCSAPL